MKLRNIHKPNMAQPRRGRDALSVFLRKIVANIFNSTRCPVVISQLRGQEKEEGKRRVNEHGPVPSTHEPECMGTFEEEDEVQSPL